MSSWHDDAGAETQANYHFQHCCTGRWCVNLLRREADVVRIRCETHDDFTIEFESRAPEIVSVKYRDGARGPWTVPRLLADGVLAGLLQRWIRIGERATCRLITNAAFADDSKRLAACCPDGDARERRDWATKLAEKLSAGLAVVDRFLGCLTLEYRGVTRETVERVEAVPLRSVIAQLNLPPSADLDCFKRIVALVAEANRAVDPVDIDAADHSLRMRTRRRDDARTIDRAKLVAAIREVRGSDEPALTGAANKRQVSTRLVAKLEAGGVPPTTVESARLLRAAWSDYESRWRPEIPGGDDEWSDLRTRVVHVASRAERAVDRTRPYGVAMLTELESTLTAAALGRAPAVQVSDMLLLGLAFELADECRIYFSPREAVQA